MTRLRKTDADVRGDQSPRGGGVRPMLDGRVRRTRLAPLAVTSLLGVLTGPFRRHACALSLFAPLALELFDPRTQFFGRTAAPALAAIPIGHTVVQLFKHRAAACQPVPAVNHVKIVSPARALA